MTSSLLPTCIYVTFMYLNKYKYYVILYKAFNDYQLQQITSNFSDQFGFTDGDYAEGDDHDKLVI